MTDMEKLINCFREIGVGCSCDDDPLVAKEVVVYVEDERKCVLAEFFFRKDDGKFLTVLT